MKVLWTSLGIPHEEGNANFVILFSHEKMKIFIFLHSKKSNFFQIKKNLKSDKAKFLMFLHYFERVTKQMPTGKITIRRQICQKYPDWGTSRTPLAKLNVHEEGVIEDSVGMLHADFANQFIGGGVIAGGMCTRRCVK